MLRTISSRSSKGMTARLFLYATSSSTVTPTISLSQSPLAFLSRVRWPMWKRSNTPVVYPTLKRLSLIDVDPQRVQVEAQPTVHLRVARLVLEDTLEIDREADLLPFEDGVRHEVGEHPLERCLDLASGHPIAEGDPCHPLDQPVVDERDSSLDAAAHRRVVESTQQSVEMGDLEERRHDVDRRAAVSERSEGVLEHLVVLTAAVGVELVELPQVEPLGSGRPPEHPVVAEEQLVGALAAEDDGVVLSDLAGHHVELHLVGHRERLATMRDQVSGDVEELGLLEEHLVMLGAELLRGEPGPRELVVPLGTDRPGVRLLGEAGHDRAVQAAAEIAPEIGRAHV